MSKLLILPVHYWKQDHGKHTLTLHLTERRLRWRRADNCRQLIQPCLLCFCPQSTGLVYSNLHDSLCQRHLCPCNNHGSQTIQTGNASRPQCQLKWSKSLGWQWQPHSSPGMCQSVKSGGKTCIINLTVFCVTYVQLLFISFFIYLQVLQALPKGLHE